MSSDKRSEPRIEVSSRVPLSWAGAKGAVECDASDISRNGIFLALDSPPPVDTVVQVGPLAAPVRGRVVFALGVADAATLGRRAGVGVQLDAAIDPDAFLLRCAEARAAFLARAEGVGASGAAYMHAAPRVAAPAEDRGAVRVSIPGAGGAARRSSQAAMSVVEVVTDVILVDGVPGQSLLAQALVADDYNPLIAKHGFEAFALAVRRRPLLCIVGADSARLSGRRFMRALKTRAEMADTVVVLVDAGDGADPVDTGTVRWRAAPTDVAHARRLVDAALGQNRAGERMRGPQDPRVLANAVADLARGFDADGDTALAMDAVRYAAELAPSVSSHTLLLARILLASPEQKQRDEGAVLVERVVRQDPMNPEVYVLRAVVYDQRGRRDEARHALKRTLMFVADHEGALAGVHALDAGIAILPLRAIAAASGAAAAAPEEEKRGLLARMFKR